MGGLIVPDLTKIPEENELTYSYNELNAIGLKGLRRLSYPSGSGFGGKYAIENRIIQMLKTPLSADSFHYRRNFFHELMSDKKRRKKLKRVINKLPDKFPDYPDRWASYNSFIRRIKQLDKLMDLPKNLDELLTGFDFQSSLYDDVKSFSNIFLGNTVSLSEKTKEIRKDETLDSSQPEEYFTRVQNILLPFKDFSYMAANLKNQIKNYLFFSHICGKGCLPRYINNGKMEGSIKEGIHPSYYFNKHYSINKSINRWSNEYSIIIPNDVMWGPDKRITLITGSNSGGKSVFLRMIGLNLLLASNGLYALADDMSFFPIRRLWMSFDFGDKLGMGHLEKSQEYIARMRDFATRNDYLLIDEPAQGTEPLAEYQLAKGLIDFAYEAGFTASVITHDVGLVKEYKNKEGIFFRRVPAADEPNQHRLIDGISDGGYGMRIAKKHGTDPESLQETLEKRIKKGDI